MTLRAQTRRKKPRSVPEVRQRIAVPLNDGQLTGEFTTFRGLSDDLEHLAIGLGRWREVETPLVRLHSQCLTGDVFGSRRCDCGAQLSESIRRIAAAGGVLLYLHQEGRGIGLYNKLDAYALQDAGFDTFSANRMLHFPSDMRDYRCAAEMLGALGIRRIRLLSNNPHKRAALVSHGIEIEEVVGTGVYQTHENRQYLQAKQALDNHNLVLENAS